MLGYVKLYFATLVNISFHQVMLCHVTSHNVTIDNVKLHYVT
jgi:hypothetical protein